MGDPSAKTSDEIFNQALKWIAGGDEVCILRYNFFLTQITMA